MRANWASKLIVRKPLHREQVQSATRGPSDGYLPSFAANRVETGRRVDMSRFFKGSRMKGCLTFLIVAPLLLTGCGGGTDNADPAVNADRARIAAIAQSAMDQYHLKALILRVTVDGQPLYGQALGESTAGVPATVDMHVRNGFVAYSYLTTVLLELVDRGQINLDDKLAQYFPALPRADAVTIQMLANSTSGYADYVYQPEVADSVDLDPYRQWTADELIRIGTSAPAMFAPGTNWGYSHTNYAILGEVLEKAGHMPLGQMMQRGIFEPMGFDRPRDQTPPRFPSRSCTPTAPSAGRHWLFRRARRSTKTRRIGARPGPRRRARCKQPISRI